MVRVRCYPISGTNAPVIRRVASEECIVKLVRAYSSLYFRLIGRSIGRYVCLSVGRSVGRVRLSSGNSTFMRTRHRGELDATPISQALMIKSLFFRHRLLRSQE